MTEEGLDQFKISHKGFANCYYHDMCNTWYYRIGRGIGLIVWAICIRSDSYHMVKGACHVKMHVDARDGTDRVKDRDREHTYVSAKSRFVWHSEGSDFVSPGHRVSLSYHTY